MTRVAPRVAPSVHAIVATAAGGPEVLELRELPDPTPGPAEVVVRVAAAGVNFIDTYRRSGLYRVPYPHVVGSEGSGEVVTVGADVTLVAPGDRVAWASSDGAYAELAVVAERDLLVVPEGVDDRVAAALPLQGLTAHYLVTSTFPVAPGHDVLVHAAAGGVGLLLTQLAAQRGARVVATVGTAEKERLAREAGAADVVRYRELDDLTRELPALVRDLTGGRGVHAVFDSVGKDTFDASLASLARRGTLVLFGASSGPVPPVDPQRLNSGGSLFLTRPTLGDHTATRDELTWRAGELFDAVRGGTLDVRVGATYPLADAADAHRALESRATTGKVLILP
ncbi:quinone oxidoreductase family protein [Cellulomonas fimi]|uniref:Alcohol dehydrogenase zinc-binding domain protein n=1 Tax=Cellulomonas fimi (strain ATCC 484 / DSM 20113 / JCM 1341 / CCUG 24087 / LMG 16345 / NBRC 15513 / NCIMB 8980 / NCTC 7547 / NRS-133) TaxID=590998 RepID=F4H7V8_CELFA|nr:Alcohol dehydrogenase zinc-binding domain protein [Cellulomonas fimi ATCC 484]VEH30610.1 Quinone oxidoreductase 1 [Cellulomonas fimi]